MVSLWGAYLVQNLLELIDIVVIKNLLNNNLSFGEIVVVLFIPDLSSSCVDGAKTLLLCFLKSEATEVLIFHIFIRDRQPECTFVEDVVI
jgi:hypothetical protein